MKVEILQPCYVDGRPCKAGDVVETPRFLLLIGSGKAKKWEPKPKDEVKSETNTRVPVDLQARTHGGRNGK